VIKGEKGEIKKTTRDRKYDTGEERWTGLSTKKIEATDNYNDKGDTHTDPNCPCRLLDEQTGYLKSGEVKPHHKKNKTANGYQGSCYGKFQNEDTTLKGYGDGGGASRFFYQAKVSKAERNMGLDGFEVEILSSTIKLLLKTDYNNKNLLWEKQDLKTKLVDTDKSHQKDIEEFGVQKNEDKKWNTELFGKVFTEQFLMDTKSIILTATNSTMIYQTLNSLIQKNIKTNIQELNGLMVKDIKLVNDVENKNIKMTFILQNKDGYFQNVNLVELKEVWTLSVKENKCSHPTLKPINLMAYLCRLITPEGGIVLDPFMGSGSTGVAAQLEGFRFVGMEMDPEYFKIAEARISSYEKYNKFKK
jgi:DNA modification methylase